MSIRSETAFSPAILPHLFTPSKSLVTFAVGAAFIYLCSLIFLRKNIKDAQGHPIPPGPLFRYAFLRKYPERVLGKWAAQYGPLFSVFMGNQLFVVISDAQVAKDLLVNNGAIFSSRKQYFIKNQTILKGRAVTGSAYDNTWRQHRRIAMQLLTPKAIKGYTHEIDYEAHMLVRSMLDDSKRGTIPINPANYAGRYAFNNMLMLSFGARADSAYDPLVARALSMTTEFMALTGPFSNPVDFIPPLQWIPTNMHSRARKLHDDLIEVYGAMIKRVQARMDADEHVPGCLAKTLIHTQEQEKLDWEDLCMLTAVFTLGGVHSASSLISWFLALIPSHPEIQRRAHEELDKVVGRDRWPNEDDEQSLPYIRAIIKEVERAHAPFWNITPHYSTEDFVYEGQFIPKDTVVVLNAYAVHHNPEKYPEPFTFNPNRYLGDTLSSAESAKLGNAADRDHWAFGAGRRICPGLVVAEHELFLAFSRLLWCYTICEAPGEPISLQEYEGKNGRSPLPFKVRLVPRHDNVYTMIDKLGEMKVEL